MKDVTYLFQTVGNSKLIIKTQLAYILNKFKQNIKNEYIISLAFTLQEGV